VDERALRRGKLLTRVAGLGVAVMTVATTIGLALGAGGCFNRNCDGDFVFYGGKPDEGRLRDPDTWETTAFDGKWLPFPHKRTWVLDTSALGTRPPESVIAYISAQETPNEVGSNFTVGGGNLVIFTVAKPGTLWVTNDTCADYFIRVVVNASPAPAPADAGTTPQPDTDASSDGGSE
jgi:hypothetical protein